MSASAWIREEEPALAADKILDAAARSFVELGVAKTGMGDIARTAGCSRGTLYRYFKTRCELQQAYVNRTAVELAARVAEGLQGIDDPRERLVEGIARALREVRETPATAVWFAPGDAGTAATISAGSDVIEALAGAFADRFAGESAGDGSDRQLARWLVRVIVSLLTIPGESEADERALVERFVAPAVLAPIG